MENLTLIGNNVMKNGKEENNSNNLDDSAIEKLTQVGREATKFEFNDLPLSPDCEKYDISYNKFSGDSIIPQETLDEIIKYDLMNYYKNHLVERRSFFKKISIEDLMKWSPDLLSKPLMKIPSNLADIALQLNKSK